MKKKPLSITASLPQVHGQIPAERDGHSSCIINDRMYVFGGYEETQFRFGLDGKNTTDNSSDSKKLTRLS